MTEVKWNWPEADLSSGADGAAMTKLFKGGMLSDAALLARESIQNSSDAAVKFARSHPNVQFRMRFRFVDYYGLEKQELVRALDLKGMATHRSSYPDAQAPTAPGSALDHLDDDHVPLPVLYVEDFGSHGLYGHPTKFHKSHLYMAMYSIGTSLKADDSGGSYGFGKSALQRASRINSVVAHSVFRAEEDDPVRSRLIGFAWWPNLQQGEILRRGQGAFAKQAEDSSSTGPQPFEEDEAVELADILGFQARSLTDPADCGTSFMIVDPSIQPLDLKEEIERWWWPAMEDHKLDVEILLPSGETLVPKPTTNPFVAQFLRGYRLATGLDEPSAPNVERVASKEWRAIRGSGKAMDWGALALVAVEQPVGLHGEESESESLVALTRGPRMVISYESYGKRQLPLRGVYVASDQANNLLRLTEPATHDRWTVNPSDDVPGEATALAKGLHTRIRQAVYKMAKDITPAPPKVTHGLSHFAKLMQGFLGSASSPVVGSGSPVEPIELQFPDGRPSLSIVDQQSVRVRSRFTVRVADKAQGEACIVRVGARLFVHEDESQSRTTLPLLIQPESRQQFSQDDDGFWTGPISKQEKLAFVVDSDPYSNLWTTSLQPVVERVSDWTDR